jgi:hypothetical protein
MKKNQTKNSNFVSVWSSFKANKSVSLTRSQLKFRRCPICDSNSESYLFHDVLGRHVKCVRCNFIFLNPLNNYLQASSDIYLQRQSETKKRLRVKELNNCLMKCISIYEKNFVRKPSITIICYASDEIKKFANFFSLPVSIVDVREVKYQDILSGKFNSIKHLLINTQLLILDQVLDHTARPEHALLNALKSLPKSCYVGIIYRNNSSFINSFLRFWWRDYASGRLSFFSKKNISFLADKIDAPLIKNTNIWTYQTISTLSEKFYSKFFQNKWLNFLSWLDFFVIRIPLGLNCALIDATKFENEYLSIILPVYNEKKYVFQVISSLINLNLPIPFEIIIVESNSTDGSRRIVESFKKKSNIKIIYEDSPKGKGHAVRTGLAHAKGSVILIQDADFEYDLDDYPSLLAPILSNKTKFVLGSRTLGLGGWKVRQYSSTPVKAFLMNFAQITFAKTYNILFRQNATDINTMFKVFRRECLSHFNLQSNGFELDIELACKLAKSGFNAYEVPVNYIGRGFEDGKKIRFFHDAFHSYIMIFRCFFINK